MNIMGIIILMAQQESHFKIILSKKSKDKKIDLIFIEKLMIY